MPFALPATEPSQEPHAKSRKSGTPDELLGRIIAEFRGRVVAAIDSHHPEAAELRGSYLDAQLAQLRGKCNVAVSHLKGRCSLEELHERLTICNTHAEALLLKVHE